jgi:dipeptide/tripeptide permease
MNDLNDNPQPQPTGREAFLAIVLSVFVGTAAVVFLIYVSGGFFAWVILGAIGMGLFAGLHYFLWGRSYSESVAQERADVEAENSDDNADPSQPWERRF